MGNEKVKISAYGIKGNKVFETGGVISKREWSIPAPNLSRGRYLLKVIGLKRSESKSFSIIQ
jgi:hypothetical protein